MTTPNDKPRSENKTPLHVLFICSMNRLRSPTAEQIFATWPGVQTLSAGLNHDADNPVTPDILQWAHLIVVMENAHRNKLQKKFKPHLKNQRIVCINIPDDYEYMESGLIELLKTRVTPLLP